MEKLNRPLEQLLKKWSLRQPVKERRALQEWPMAAGKKLSACTRAVAVKKGILFVLVPNSSWAQHMSFFKPTLLKKINRRLQGNVILDIRFQVGKIPEPEGTFLTDEPKALQLDDLERKKIAEMFADFRGEAIMKEKLMQLMEKELLTRKQKAAWGWVMCAKCGSYGPPEGICPLCKI